MGRQGKIKAPAWVDFAKTASFKELAPTNEDWFYIRCAYCPSHLPPWWCRHRRSQKGVRWFCAPWQPAKPLQAWFRHCCKEVCSGPRVHQRPCRASVWWPCDHKDRPARPGPSGNRDCKRCLPAAGGGVNSRHSSSSVQAGCLSFGCCSLPPPPFVHLHTAATPSSLLLSFLSGGLGNEMNV